MTGIEKQYQKTVNFIKQDVWRIRRTHLTPGKSFFLNLLRVVILSVRGFDEDKCQLRASALTAREISNRLEILIRFVNDILFELVKSNILSTTESEEDGDPGYQPALDPDKLTIQYVVEAMEHRGLNAMPFIHAPEFDALSASLESFGRTIDQLPENILLKKL